MNNYACFRKWAVILLLGMLAAGCSDYNRARSAFQRGNYADAYQGFKALARAGDARAQYDLAQMYLQGLGVPADPQAGREWLVRAANNGEPAAMIDLAQRFEFGVGAEPNYVMARTWYKKAAAKGEPIAAFNLGMMYIRGNGVPRDLVRAYAWMRIAEKNSSPAATSRLQMLRDEMDPEALEQATKLVDQLLADPDA